MPRASGALLMQPASACWLTVTSPLNAEWETHWPCRWPPSRACAAIMRGSIRERYVLAARQAYGAEIGDGAQRKGKTMNFKRKKFDHEEYTWAVQHKDITIVFKKRKSGGWASLVPGDDRAYQRVAVGKTINETAQKVAGYYDAFLAAQEPTFVELELASLEPIENDIVEVEIDFGATKEITVTEAPKNDTEEQPPFEALLIEETCKLVSRTFSGAKRYFMRKTAKYVPFGEMIAGEEK